MTISISRYILQTIPARVLKRKYFFFSRFSPPFLHLVQRYEDKRSISQLVSGLFSASIQFVPYQQCLYTNTQTFFHKNYFTKIITRQTLQSPQLLIDVKVGMAPQY